MVTDEEIYSFLEDRGIQAPILTSSLQRRFGIGYREAASIMDRLVKEGCVTKYFPEIQLRYILKTK
jgi:DNA segregation ATPase FtsK/SpoIIIE-like protein